MNREMYDRTHVDGQAQPHQMNGQSGKQAWHRPTVTFVPIQVTAGSVKNASNTDGGDLGTFGP